MPKFRVLGQLYEPSCDGADKDGYIRFWDVVEAVDTDEAIELTRENYGEYNSITVYGEATNEAEEKAWLAKNPD